MRDITFINARDILGIIYTSKSGNTKLKWRQLRGRIGRITGEASGNSLGNLVMSRVISPEEIEAIMASQQGQEEPHPNAEGESMQSPPEAEQKQD
jgi:hypothetical protein